RSDRPDRPDREGGRNGDVFVHGAPPAHDQLQGAHQRPSPSYGVKRYFFSAPGTSASPWPGASEIGRWPSAQRGRPMKRSSGIPAMSSTRNPVAGAAHNVLDSPHHT